MKRDYYCAREYECIDIIEAYGLNFSRGNALKYILRAGHKDGVDELDDLLKAVDYLKREIKRVSREISPFIQEGEDNE